MTSSLESDRWTASTHHALIPNHRSKAGDGDDMGHADSVELFGQRRRHTAVIAQQDAGEQGGVGLGELAHDN
jgi:hypothetical protein